MQNIKVIIGASYGDEGKGLATDYFGSKCSGSTIAVIGNGGAQRGHTVETADGLRHVFHHFSSSTLNGHSTYCAEEFILNPMICMEEYDLLSDMGCRPGLILHPDCRVSTPYDMLINQILLAQKGVHNSCGLGIWETVVRTWNKKAFRIGEIARLSDEEQIRFVRDIRDHYLPERLRQYGIREIPGEFSGLLQDEGLLRHYMEDLRRMLAIARIQPASWLTRFQNVLYENGQGLLLDGNNPATYEDSTPSTTGLGRISKTIEKHFRDAAVEVCYISRSYLTRHGDGALQGECSREEIGEGIRDLTNEANPFQGALRYAGMPDTDALMKRVLGDFEHFRGSRNRYQCSMMITHLNECPLDTSGLKERIPRLYGSDGREAGSVIRL